MYVLLLLITITFAIGFEHSVNLVGSWREGGDGGSGGGDGDGDGDGGDGGGGRRWRWLTMTSLIRVILIHKGLTLSIHSPFGI